jgi:glycerophosphoryl diester phosphodiesterase
MATYYQYPLIIFFIVATIVAIPNPASYIRQQGRPLNIAHRGLSSILPENTLEAFESALYQGADFIELDIVYTK